jgi:glycosyltransferase involved in cell wall biosynthesis
VCAEEDVRAFPHGTGQVVPNTIVNASTSASIAEEECRIIFHGTLTYPPNEDAVRSLLDDIAPLVWAQKPEAKFVVAGKLPDGLADTWQAEDRIEFTGFVPDMWAELAKATIVVAPIRYGGGTRVKLIEAAAAGKAVVSTPIGAEGLPFTQGSDIMLATGPSNFANAVVTLLDDRLLRHQLGSRARVSFEAAMSPIAVERAVEEVLRAVQTPTQTL